MNRLTLRHRLLLLTLLPSAVIAIALVSYFTITGINTLEGELRTKGMATVRYLAPISEYGIIAGQVESLHGLAQATVQEAGVKAAIIVNQKGRAIAVSGRVSLASETLRQTLSEPSQVAETDRWVAFGAPVRRSLNEADTLFEPVAPFIDQNRDNKFSDRMAYSYQLIVARKFHKRFSLQVAPTYVHKNLVPRATDSNDIFVAAIGARFKFSKRSSITAEYGYILPVGQVPDYAGRQVRNSASIGMDIETGGHVFQFQLTNSLAVFNRAIWTETTDDWLNGGIHLGFNISRVFDLKR